MQRNKTMIATIALVLMLTMAASLICLPAVNAQPISNPYKQMYLYVSVEPNPVGVGQQALVVWWIDLLPPTPPTGEGSWSDFDRWHGVTVTITKPDGTNQTMGPYTSDPVGGNYLPFVPDTVGSYTFQANWPGEWKNTTTYLNFYSAATSAKAELTVQQEPLTALPATPLPTGYWTRPINAYNREWSQIAGNWLADVNSNPALYTTAPNTAHIVWTKPIAFGGITGGQFGSTSYYTGSAYEGKWSPPVIMNGYLYYNLPRSDSTTSAYGGFVCVDLRTGEQLYFVNGTRINMGVIYDYESPNQHGTIPYLWATGTTSYIYDPFTGQWLYTITNVPSGTAAVGPDGSRLIYVLNAAQKWLALWNASAIVALWGGTTGTTGWQWRPVGKTVDGSQGYSWNVTLSGLPATASITYVSSDILIASATYSTIGKITRCGYSLKEGQIGSLLWSQNYTLPPGNQTISFMGPMSEGVFTYKIKETNQWYGFDAYTGNQLWGPTESQDNWDMYSQTANGQIAYGKLYSCGMSGIMYAYNLTTGKLLWTWHTDPCGLEGPYEYWPLEWTGFTIADEKIYIVTGEHSQTQPIYRGWKMYCIDANTGQGIWNITSVTQSTTPPVAIADGYAVTLNGMDNQIYCYGKGQTATTVEAPMTAITAESSVVVRGAITDESAGAKGTPAISDGDMTAWMEYLYHQKSMPTNAKGVAVTLDAVDPNGNFIHIGDATSDLSGAYSYVWNTPDIPGKYTIIATFQGSSSYFASHSETAAVVSEAPLATAPPEYPQPIDYTWFFVGTALAIIFAVAIVGILMLRKRP
jgi:hypothetical protein